MAQKNLNIVCVTADLIPEKLGGAELHVVEVIKRLAKKHKIHLFVGQNTSIQKIFPKSVKVYPINYPKIPNLYGLFYILFGYFQIKKILTQADFDILWAKQSFPQAPLAALLKKTFNKPLYITAQNPMLHQEELVIKGRLLKPFHSKFAQCLTPLISWSFRKADHVAAVSHYSAKLSRQMGAQKVTVIPNGIDLTKYNNLKKSKNKTFTIISASALIPRNGLDTLIKAIFLLPQDLNCKLVIAGDGPEEENLKSQTSSLKVKKKVKFLGRLPNSKIPKFLSTGDVFIRPSRWEGFGVAFIEAMAAKIPVIATPIGGIPDFLIHQKTGLLVKPDNPQQLAHAIQTIVKNKNLSSSLTKNAYKLVKTKYQWDKITKLIDKKMLTLCH